MNTYRMTRDEFERFISENDPLATDLPAVVQRVVSLVHESLLSPYQVNLGYAGVSYDAGWYWVRTSRAVEWM